MAIGPLAVITSGAVADSTSVDVSCADADGTSILLFRGESQIGAGLLASGVCTIAVVSLTEGDVIYASVTEKGNRCGRPVVVTTSSIRLSGWKTPTELNVVFPDGTTLAMPVDQFEQEFGFRPASIFDPEGTAAIIYPEYETPSAVTDLPIQFDLLINQKFGETQIFVQNVRNTKGSILVRFNGGSWGNTLSITSVVAANITIDVRGEDDTEFESRTVAVTISSVTVNQYDISYVIGYGVNSVSLKAHNMTSLQFRLEGFNVNWYDGSVYDINRWEKTFEPVPAGNYIGWVRPSGDTNPAHWSKIEFTKLQ